MHYALTLALALLIIGCESTPEDAQQELADRGIATQNFSWYAGQGDLDIVKLFVAARINVNAKNSKGFTALHAAANEGHLAVVQFLVEKGADVNSDHDGWTPLYMATGHGHLAVVQFLVEKGADIHADRPH